MKRYEVEKWMKDNKLTQLDVIIRENDALAIYCQLQNGVLKDYTGHVVVGKQDNIYGYLIWTNGIRERRAF